MLDIALTCLNKCMCTIVRVKSQVVVFHKLYVCIYTCNKIHKTVKYVIFGRRSATAMQRSRDIVSVYYVYHV